MNEYKELIEAVIEAPDPQRAIALALLALAAAVEDLRYGLVESGSPIWIRLAAD